MENIVHLINLHDQSDHGHGDPAHASLSNAVRTDPLSSALPREFKPVNPDDPLHPCSVLDERYAVDCYLMQTSVMLYHNHGDLYNAAFTFLEPLPVGVPMTLISAAILRKRRATDKTDKDQD